MTLGLSDYVNELSQTSRLSNIPNYIAATTESSPIDDFRTSLLEHLSIGSEVALNSNELMGRLLCIGIVSAAENYFRSIISGIINICPVAQTCAADRPVSLGSVTWHTGTRYSRSAFEHASLAEAKGLERAFRESVAINLPPAEFADSLKEYERVCQLRHGIVHNDGFLPGKNALKLEVPRMSRAARIVIRYDQLQEVAAVVNALVRLLNRHLFQILCKRWAVDWRARSDWNAADEEAAFTRIWDLFLSKRERELRAGRSRITKKLCLAQVKQDFGIG